MKKIVAVSILTLIVCSIIIFGGYVIMREYITAIEQNEVFDISMPVQRASKSEVAEMLMTNWLQRFTTQRYVGKIYDYKIHSIRVDEEGNNYFCFVAEYSVKTDEESDWKNGIHTVDGGWVNIKGRFRVNKVGNMYKFIVF
ncbi:MAG TPA: hypothetical protein VFZ66_03815 [Herpetosiphonaceae bacterium]